MTKYIFKALVSMLKSSSRVEGRSWTSELFCRALQLLFGEGANLPIGRFRKLINKGTVHSATRKVSSNRSQVAGVRCLLVSPKSAYDDSKMLVYYHGGGYTVGSPESYLAIVAQLAVNSNCMVVVPDYRLAPENPFPAPQDDALAVAQTVINTYPDRKVILAGDSAGGALAISAALGLAAQDSMQADALVLLSPWVDPTADSGTIISNDQHDFLSYPFLQRSYSALVKEDERNDPRVNFRDADLSALPTSLVQYGGAEIFSDQIDEFVDRAKSEGVNIESQCYESQFHVFHVSSAFNRQAAGAMSDIARFVEEV